MSAAAPAVELAGLVRRYGERRAVDGVSFTVPHGELFGLLGPNGGGKTTLFRVLTTLLPPSDGDVTVLGHALPAGAAAVRESIGVVFQSPSLDGHLTVRENLVHQGHLYGLRGAGLRTRVTEALARVAVDDRANDLVRDLSGGLKRRVELAKAFLHRPQLLLLDEPTTGLDPGARRDVWTHLSRLRDEDGVTSIVTTHLMEEAERCDRVAILDEGRLVALGTPAELRASIGAEVVTAVPSASESIGEFAAAAGERLGVTFTVSGGALRTPAEGGARLVAALLDAFPDELASVTVGRPTLEDVFLAKTGHTFT